MAGAVVRNGRVDRVDHSSVQDEDPDCKMKNLTSGCSGRRPSPPPAFLPSDGEPYKTARMSLGGVLAHVRRERGYRQPDLAEHLGVAVSTVAAWESKTDPREPGAAHIREICKFLHISADMLLELEPLQLTPVPPPKKRQPKA